MTTQFQTLATQVFQNLEEIIKDTKINERTRRSAMYYQAELCYLNKLQLLPDQEIFKRFEAVSSRKKVSPHIKKLATFYRAEMIHLGRGKSSPTSAITDQQVFDWFQEAVSNVKLPYHIQGIARVYQAEMIYNGEVKPSPNQDPLQMLQTIMHDSKASKDLTTKASTLLNKFFTRNIPTLIDNDNLSPAMREHLRNVYEQLTTGEPNGQVLSPALLGSGTLPSNHELLAQ